MVARIVHLTKQSPLLIDQINRASGKTQSRFGNKHLYLPQEPVGPCDIVSVEPRQKRPPCVIGTQNVCLRKR